MSPAVPLTPAAAKARFPPLDSTLPDFATTSNVDLRLAESIVALQSGQWNESLRRRWADLGPSIQPALPGRPLQTAAPCPSHCCGPPARASGRSDA
jgi:hypothetical protein